MGQADEPKVTWVLPGGSRERWVDDYDRGRPGWPPGVVSLAPLPSSATVVDLGAGTGKLTQLLVRSFRHVIAVEPQPAMRVRLAALYPQAESLEGSAYRIPLPDSAVDAVFVAQAFHWFANPQGVAEIARVLRLDGVLVIMWNVPAGSWDPPITAIENLLRPLAPPEADTGVDPFDLSRQHARGRWRTAFVGSGFGSFDETRLPNTQTLDRAGLEAFLASLGWIAELPDDERVPLLAKVRRLLNAAEYTREWETLAFVAKLERAAV